MARSKILLAGESWVTTATHIKGFDQFPTVTFHRGAEALADALADSDFALTYMPAHEAQTHFRRRSPGFGNTTPSFSATSAPTPFSCIPIRGSTASPRRTGSSSSVTMWAKAAA